MEQYIKEKYEKWLNADLPQDLKEQLESLNEEQINDCFYCDLEFGTAGIRGVLGPGSNRLNIYVIRKVSKAFAEFLIQSDPKAKEDGVVISHDNRLYSREFTRICKNVSELWYKSIYFRRFKSNTRTFLCSKKITCGRWYHDYCIP